jgi:hypothetical protein
VSSVAAATEEETPIWGGMTERERRALRLAAARYGDRAPKTAIHE